MVLTEAQLHEVALRVRSIIRAESTGVGDLPVTESLEGIVSLPALRKNGEVPEVVEAPVSLLQDLALEVVTEAATAANTAAEEAVQATERANTSAENANASAERVETAIENASQAATNANAAAERIDTAIAGADEAASRADEATVGAVEATAASETVAADAREQAGYAKMQGDYAKVQGDLVFAEKGAAGGLAELDASGKVPASQLPSYVDDVLEFSSRAEFPETGESGKIYIAVDTNLTYRWSGSNYVEISFSLALGTTPSTAGRGDWTKAAYDHSLATDGRNPHQTTFASLPDKPASLPANGGNADAANTLRSNGDPNSTAMQFNWNGQEGQPWWLWGGNNVDQMYVYNPSNFYVEAADKLTAYYTGDGGRQGPGYFGKNKFGCLMMNTPVNGNSNYKNWLICDAYGGPDVGGATAIGVDRQSMRVFAMSSNADRANWDRSCEVWTTANFDPSSVSSGLNIPASGEAAVQGWTYAGKQVYVQRWTGYFSSYNEGKTCYRTLANIPGIYEEVMCGGAIGYGSSVIGNSNTMSLGSFNWNYTDGSVIWRSRLDVNFYGGNVSIWIYNPNTPGNAYDVWLAYTKN